MTTYLPADAEVCYHFDPLAANVHERCSLFLPDSMLHPCPSAGYPYVNWMLASGLGENFLPTAIDQTSEALHGFLESGFAVVASTATFNGQAVPGAGKFQLPWTDEWKLCPNGWRDAAMVRQFAARQGALGNWPIDQYRDAQGGRSGGAHLTLSAALAEERDPAVNGAYAGSLWPGISTRPKALISMSPIAWWPACTDSVPPVGFSSANGLVSGVPGQLKAHASSLRYAFDVVNYPGLGGTGGLNINAIMPVWLFAQAPPAGIESPNFTDGFGDGAYHGTYASSVCSDAHSSWHVVALFNALRALNPSFHTRRSALVLDISQQATMPAGAHVSAYTTSTADWEARMLTWLKRTL